MKFLLNSKISFLVLVVGLMTCHLISADTLKKSKLLGDPHKHITTVRSSGGVIQRDHHV